MMRKTMMTGLLLLTALAPVACATSSAPPAPLQFVGVAPIMLEAGSVDVIREYDAQRDPKDVSSTLPTPLDRALESYAQNRLKAGAYEGILKFTIEDASVRKTIVPPDSQMLDMMKLGTQDRYDANMIVRLVRVMPDGRESAQGTIRLRRFITIPQSYSMAKRDYELQRFVESMMNDVDDSVITTVRDQMKIMAPRDGVSNTSSAMPAPPAVPVPPVEMEHPW